MQLLVFLLFFIMHGVLIANPTQAPFTAMNQLCDSVRVIYDYDLGFTRTEQNLLCGTDKLPSWKNIPANQARRLMAGFLEARGYHRPQFSIEADRLYVRPGTLTLITELISPTVIPGLDLSEYWLPIGKPLTPETLNTIEKWVASTLGHIGYPCAVISSRGDPASGKVLINALLGERWTFDRLEEDPIPYVRGGMLERYQAFSLGQTYDSRLLELSSQRLIQSQVVVNSRYQPDCKAEKPGLIRHELLAGAPRLVGFGLGFDTENLFIVRGSWSNSRLSETASLLDLSSTFSYRAQNILALFDWYYLPIPSRHYLKTSFKMERLFERRFETRTIRSTVAPAWTYDWSQFSTHLYLGPSIQSENSQRGNAPKTARLVSLDLGFGLESHLFEYYSTSPKTGYRLNLETSYTAQEAFSDISASKTSIDFTWLWNVLDLDPEIWILGTRGRLASSRPQGETSADELPASYRYFLGGSQDMRGFARQSLPIHGSGALTEAYWGHELRLNNVLPMKIQPLIFADWGWLGDKPSRLDPTQFFSPGFGARWESPFGAMRASFAHGRISGPNKALLKYLETWQFYFSFGEQF